MSDPIQSLDDVTAVRILKRIASARPAPVDGAPTWNEDLKQALVDDFQIAEPSDSGHSSDVSEGELARQALLVLAEDPAMRKSIEKMAASASDNPQVFDLGLTIALTAAVLLVLQTHVKFTRDSSGKWSLDVEKKPTSDTLLKGLVQKLVSFAK
jgi:hypothetical protein